MVALAVEAKPIIQHYKLQKVSDTGGFPHYQRNEINLIVCGVGMLNMAAACSLLFAEQQQLSIWLNCGIAAAKDIAIGRVFCCHKITHQSIQKHYYPSMVTMHGIDSESITCSECANFDYEHEGLLDMESAAFFQFASRYSSNEISQCLKVVSDNANHQGHQLNNKDVEPLMLKLLPTIDQAIEQLQQSVAYVEQSQLNVTKNTNDCIQHWHFTHSRQHQLMQQLQRWEVLLPNTAFDVEKWSSCNNAKDFLHEITTFLDKQYEN